MFWPKEVDIRPVKNWYTEQKEEYLAQKKHVLQITKISHKYRKALKDLKAAGKNIDDDEAKGGKEQ